MDFKKIAEEVNGFITAAKPYIDKLEPVVNAGVSTFAPEAAAGVAIGEKLLQGLLDGVPAATTLVTQITSGTPATPEQVASFEASYEGDYQATKAKLAAAIRKAAGG